MANTMSPTSSPIHIENPAISPLMPPRFLRASSAKSLVAKSVTTVGTINLNTKINIASFEINAESTIVSISTRRTIAVALIASAFICFPELSPFTSLSAYWLVSSGASPRTHDPAVALETTGIRISASGSIIGISFAETV